MSSVSDQTLLLVKYSNKKLKANFLVTSIYLESGSLINLFCAEKSKMKDVEQFGARRGPLRRGCVLLDHKAESKKKIFSNAHHVP